MVKLQIAQDEQADAVLSEDPFALLAGMLLDQQFPMERAFAGPAKVLERFGTLDPGAVAAAEPVLLGVLENIFHLDGELGHEVVFVHTGRLDPDDVVPPEGATFSDNGRPMPVLWRPVEDAGMSMPLYPHGAGNLARRAPSRCDSTEPHGIPRPVVQGGVCRPLTSGAEVGPRRYPAHGR